LGKRFDRSEMFRRAFGNRRAFGGAASAGSGAAVTGASAPVGPVSSPGAPAPAVVVASPSLITGNKYDPNALSNLKSFLPPDVQMDDTMVENLARAAAELHHQRSGRGGVLHHAQHQQHQQYQQQPLRTKAAPPSSHTSSPGKKKNSADGKAMTQSAVKTPEEIERPGESAAITSSIGSSTVAWSASEMATVKSAMDEMAMDTTATTTTTTSAASSPDNSVNTTSNPQPPPSTKRQQENKVMRETAKEVAKTLPNKTEVQVQAFMKNHRDMHKLQQINVGVVVSSPEKKKTDDADNDGGGEGSVLAPDMVASTFLSSDAVVAATTMGTGMEIGMEMTTSSPPTLSSTSTSRVGAAAAAAAAAATAAVPTGGGGGGGSVESPRRGGRGKKPPTTPLHTVPTIRLDVRDLLKKNRKKTT
jgi:hypothetical protein